MRRAPGRTPGAAGFAPVAARGPPGWGYPADVAPGPLAPPPAGCLLLGFLLLGLLLVGCLPSPGPFALAAAEGRVLDRDDGTPIEDAFVLQAYHGAGVSDGTRPEYHARWTRSDAAGRFSFARRVAPSPRMWLLRTYGPSYLFHHPDYGLVRGPRDAPGGALLELRGSRAEAPLRRADLDPYCRGEVPGRGARELARVACSPRPERPPRSP